MKKLLVDAIERDKDALFEILKSLVGINSENFRSHGKEIECPEFIGEYLKNI